MLDQAANRRQELVEPAGQLRGFVAATDLQVLGQVAFALRDAFQATGDTADRPHDQAGETGPDHGEDRRQDCGDDCDQPGQLGRFAHHIGLLDQADERPAQLLRRPDVGHVALAVQFDFHQALAGLGQLRVTLAQGVQRLEVVLGSLWVDQHGAVVFHQHQVAGFAELDLFDQFGELGQRHVDTDHAAIDPQLVIEGAHGADVGGVVIGPVIGRGAQRFARVGLGGLVPGALARVVVGQFGVIGPGHVAAGAGADDGVGVGGVTVAQVLQEGEHLFVHLALRDVRRVGGHVGLEAGVGVLDQRQRGQIVDVLADAVEKHLHGVADLANLASAAVDKGVLGITAQVHHHQGGNQDHGQAGNDCKCPGQFLFDVHPRSTLVLIGRLSDKSFCHG